MAETTVERTCLPRIITVDDSCGCTLTRANIQAMTPEAFVALGNLEVDMQRIIEQTKELRTIGVKENSLMDLLISRTIPRGGSSVGKESVIQPFTLKPQESNVNVNWFKIISGAATTGAGTGAIPASAWDIVVNTGPSPFKSALVNLEKYFLPGKYILVRYVDSAAGNIVRTLNYKVLSAVNANGGGEERAKITLQPNVTDTKWATLSGGEKLVYQPTHGSVINLANSVSDYESWCYQYPAENSRALRAFWKQTIRRTNCYNDEYLKALGAPLTSSYFRQFKEMPLAKQRRIQGMREERDYFNTVFFGDEINEHQTTGDYANLPQVQDPANPGCTIEFKANTLGVRRQLAECNRVVDLAGGALDMDMVIGALYNLKRNREISSGSIQVIDALTDRFTADSLRQVFGSYYKDKYGWEQTRFAQLNQKITYGGQIMFNHDMYDIPEVGVQLAVFNQDYFNDNLAAHAAPDVSAGRHFMMLDWSDFGIDLYGTNSATRQTNVADNLYNCVLTPNVNHYQLNSQTIQVVVGDQNRSLWFENFSGDCPLLTATPCNPVS